MRVGILTQYYPPEVGAPQVRLSSLARRLVDRGHEVFVLTAMPNYPTGRVYPGYGGLFRSEVADGVTVLRSWIVPAKGAGMTVRLANYFSFVLSSLVIGLVKMPRLDYLVTESPPLFLGMTGFVLARAKRARWILNVSDLWPDSVEMLGVTRSEPLLRTARALERFCYRHASLVTGQTRGIVKAVAERSPATATQFYPNGVDLDSFATDGSAIGDTEVGRTQAASTCIFIYAGLHGLAQGLDQIIDALSILGPRDDLRVDLVGDGPEKDALRQRVDAAGLKTIRFLDPIPHDQIPALLRSADVAIVPLRYVITEAVPSKLYEAMAAGRAVLLVSEGEAVRLVEEARAGVSVRPGDIPALAQAIDELAADASARRRMGGSAEAFANERFDRRRINDALIDRLEGDLAN